MSWEDLLPRAPQGSFFDAFNSGRQVAIADQVQQRQTKQWQREDAVNARNDAMLANRQAISPLLAQGDYAGAQKAALAHGDLEWHARIEQLAKDNQAQAA